MSEEILQQEAAGQEKKDGGEAVVAGVHKIGRAHV